MAEPDTVEDSTQGKCNLCNLTKGKYVCPKCGIFYCSLICYKSEKHLECSEKFYESNVREFLENSEENPEKIQEILSRHHVEDQKEDEGILDSDDENYLDLSERMKNVDLEDSEKVWDNLTEDEKKDFMAFLQSGEVAKLIPEWQPWWKFEKKIEILDNRAENPKFPSIEILERFKNLIQKRPAETVKYNLINILAGYLFIARYFNGEYMDFPQECTSCLAKISECLNSHQDFENFEISVASVEQKCITTDWIHVDVENMNNLRNDLEIFLEKNAENPENFYLKCALCDLHKLIERSLENKENSHGKVAGNFPEIEKQPRRNLKNFKKRVEYFLCYVQNFF